MMDENTTEFEFDTITLTMEDDSEVLCAVLANFNVEGNEYVALLEINEEGEQLSDHPYFYHYEETEDGEVILNDIEDDDEYDAVVDCFDDLLEDAEEI